MLQQVAEQNAVVSLNLLSDIRKAVACVPGFEFQTAMILLGLMSRNEKTLHVGDDELASLSGLPISAASRLLKVLESEGLTEIDSASDGLWKFSLTPSGTEIVRRILGRI